MRKETIERKKKASKKKGIVNNIIKEEGIDKSLSTNEKNKLILKAMTNSSEEEIQEETEIKKVKTSVREFKCQCGFTVRLEGDVAKEKIDKCSVCRSK